MKQKSKKKIITWFGLIFLALSLVFLVVFIFSSKKNKQAMVNNPKPENLANYPWGNTDDLVKSTSIGETALHENFIRAEKEGLDFKMVFLASNKESYKNGEQVVFTGFVENFEKFPFLGMSLYGILSKEDQDSEKKKENGDFIIRDFFILKDFSVNPLERKNIKFNFTLPQNIANGKYRLKYFLFDNNKFLWAGGDPFGSSGLDTPDVIFTVQGAGDEDVFLDKDNVFISNESLKEFRQRKNIVNNLVAEDDLSIKFKILNKSSNEEEVLLYYLHEGVGDFLNKIDQNSFSEPEKITIPAQGEREVVHNIKINQRLKTVLQIKMVNKGDRISIINVPILAENVPQPAFWFKPIITAFPIKEGDYFEVMTGFNFRKFPRTKMSEGGSTTKEGNIFKNEGKIEIKLYDKDNQEVGGMLFDGFITGDSRSWSNRIKAEKNLDYLRMVGKIYDQNGVEYDHFEKIYDCQKLGSYACYSTDSNKRSLIYIITGLFSIFLILLLIFLKLLKK